MLKYFTCTYSILKWFYVVVFLCPPPSPYPFSPHAFRLCRLLFLFFHIVEFHAFFFIFHFNFHLPLHNIHRYDELNILQYELHISLHGFRRSDVRFDVINELKTGPKSGISQAIGFPKIPKSFQENSTNLDQIQGVLCSNSSSLILMEECLLKVSWIVSDKDWDGA